MSNLPSIGRNGLVNAVRILSGNTVPGWKDVGASESFIAGQVATLVANSTTSNPELQTVAANTEKPIGLFFCHKATSFYRPVIDVAYDAPAVTTGTISLAHVNIKTDSVKIVRTSTGSIYTITTNYTVDLTRGIITNVNITEDTPLTISYLYEDTSLTGIDQTLGSGKASFISDPAEIATLVYDVTSTTAYTLGAPLYSSTSGYITATNPGGSSYTIGTVTKVPTTEDPELWVRLRIS